VAVEVIVAGGLDTATETGETDSIVADFPKSIAPMTEVRSTLVTSSLAALRNRNLFERYDAIQRSAHRDTILNCVAGEWLSLEVAFAHYRACDALGLSSSEQIEIGKDVSKRIHETFLGLVVKAARGMGVTPWLLLAKANTTLSRIARGGGIRVTRVGPKSARIELVQVALLQVPYFRNALVGVYIAGVELLGSNVTARVISQKAPQPERQTVLRIDWT